MKPTTRAPEPGQPSAAARRTPPVVYGITVAAAVGGFLFGYDTGVIAGALPHLTEDFGLTPFTSGVVVSALLVGAMIGAFGAGPLADRFGRRRLIMAAAAVFGAGSVIAALAPNAATLTGARVVLGLAVGAASSLVPVFIAETAPPHLRGRLVSVNQLLITIGIVGAYAAGYAFSGSGNWRAMFALAVLPSLVLFGGMALLPETPRWLAGKGREEEALRVLARLRPGADPAEELAALRETGEAPRRATLSALRHRWLRPALVAGVGLQILGQASGINTVIYYAPTIFERAGIGTAGATLATVGVGLVNVLFTLVGMALVDRVGRKPLLAGGAAVMALSLAGLASVAGGHGGQAGYLAVACVAAYIAAAAAALCVVIFIVPAELYPTQVRGTAMSVSLAANWTMNFLVSLTFLSLLQALGVSATFWLYAGICALLVLFTLRCIPETKGRSLEEIEQGLRAGRG
ncbi:sugar porter family MFS transporter [Streptomyces sp. ODS28]|uniref:sugar porter family MFS transporter n=1 Tax=Streptomyces sp. ODS28 TaxID=3136688 RepID=UPI0031F05DEC